MRKPVKKGATLDKDIKKNNNNKKRPNLSNKKKNFVLGLCIYEVHDTHAQNTMDNINIVLIF